MAPPNEDEHLRYLFESSALAAMLSNGNDVSHAAIEAASGSLADCLATTRNQKDDFLDMFPDDKVYFANNFGIENATPIHTRLAGSLSDKIDNQPDVNDSDIQDFIRLVAVAKTSNRVIVIDRIGADRLFEIADSLDAEAIDCNELTIRFK